MVTGHSVGPGGPKTFCQTKPGIPSFGAARLGAGNEAGQVYEQLTGLHMKLESQTDAAAAWVDASRAYSKAGVTDSGRSSSLSPLLPVLQGLSRPRDAFTCALHLRFGRIPAAACV